MKRIKMLCMISLFTISLLTPATKLLAETDNLNQGQGTIEQIDFKKGIMVVDDAKLLLIAGYTVLNGKGEEVSAFNLRQGSKVSVKYAPGMVVKEITILR